MIGTPKYPAELRERAIRMVQEHRRDYASEWAAIGSNAAKLGIAAPETLQKWIRRAEVDGGQRPGVTSAEREQLVQLERENRELRRANEIVRCTYSAVGRHAARRSYSWISPPRRSRWASSPPSGTG